MNESTAAKMHATNIETIVRLEAEDEERVSHTDRLSAAIGKFAGTTSFIAVQLAGVAAWIAINTPLTLVPAFDPYPFPLLAVVLGLEAVLLTTFVLIRQNRMSLRAEQRSHLDLQINLLTEREVTKIIQLVHAMSKHLGIEEHVADAEIRQLGEETEVEDIARDIRKNFDEEAAPAG